MSIDLAQVDQPIETAVGLPRDLYTDPDWLASENQHIFAANWIAIALTDDVPGAGEVFPTQAAGQALIVVRDGDKTIRVFHNVCRHRGARLVDQPCRTNGLLVCPYHAWSYQLNGELSATPHFSGIDDHRHDSLGTGTQNLVEVKSAVWNHIVFVNLDGKAAPLLSFTHSIDDRWSAYDLTNVRQGGTDHFELRANWKLVLENFVESYHLPMVHRGLNSYSSLADHELVVDDYVMGQVSLHYDPRDAGAELPRFTDLPQDLAGRAEYLLLFPNVMLSVTPDHYRVTLVTPVSPCVTHQRWVFFFVGEESQQDRYQEARQTVVDRVGAVTAEDVGILEKMQAGRNSQGFDGGRFSPYHEKTTHRFHQLVARHLSENHS